MLVTTTSTLETQEIKSYLGIVTGEIGFNGPTFSKKFEGSRGNAEAKNIYWAQSLREAKDMALQEMTVAAEKTGANAVVGVNFSLDSLGEGYDRVMVTYTGTAVKTVLKRLVEINH